MTDHDAGYWTANRAGSLEARRAVTLTDLIWIPVHRWRIVAALALAGLLVAIGYLILVPNTVTASAVVAVRPVVTDAFTASGAAADRSVNMNVESGIATSTEVIQKLAQATGKDPLAIRDALEIEVPTGGQILRFVYTAPTVEEVVRTVNLAAETYLEVRRGMYERQRTAMLESYDASIAKVNTQRTTVQRRAAEASGSAAEAVLAELGAINNQLVELNSSRTEIAAIDVNPGWVTQAAEQSLVDSGSNRLLYLVAAVLATALIGVVITYLRESFDRRVRSAADAYEATALPLLGTVRARGLRVAARAVDADVRYVAMAIAEKFGQTVPTPVVVISARAQEDTTLLTASLAVALAADGADVYIGDDSGRLDALREVLMADRQRVPSRPFVPEQTGQPVPALAAGTRPAVTAAQPRSAPPASAVAPQSAPPVTTQPIPPHGGPARPDQFAPDATQQISVGTGGVPAPRGAWSAPPAAAAPGERRRRPSPYPVTVEDGRTLPLPGQRPTPDGPAGADATMTIPRVPAAPAPVRGAVAKVAVRTLPGDAITVGTGMVRIGSYQKAPETDIVLFNAPPGESDERGVREARTGTAIVVVELDRTRAADLRRLVERLRASGAQPLGFVLTQTNRD